MALQIIDGGKIRQDTLIVTIFGLEGIGKTSLALSARNPILLDFDSGSHRSSNRGGKAIVRVPDWNSVASIDAADLAPYDTVIVDTIGTALDSLMLDIMRRDPKMSVGGAPSQRAYGVLKSSFALWLGKIREAGKNIVFVAHTKEEQRGEDVVVRIQATGQSRDLVAHLTDMGGKLYLDHGGRRMLTFNPRADSYGKNSAGIQDAEVPAPHQAPDFLQRVIEQSLTNINDMRTGDVAETERLEALQEKLDAFAGPDEYSDYFAELEAAGADEVDKRIVARRAKDLGYYADKESRRWFADEAAAKAYHKAKAAPPADPPPQPVAEQPNADEEARREEAKAKLTEQAQKAADAPEPAPDPQEAAAAAQTDAEQPEIW